MNEREIFDAALEISDAESQAVFLDQACGGKAALRQHIAGLLAAQQQLGSFLQESPAAVAVNALATLDHAASEKIGTQIGPYKLLEQIGEGGMGLVYMAEQQQPLKRLVALKIIKPGMDSRQVIARFEAERQALALMEHPNIARILDAGTVGEVASGQEPVASDRDARGAASLATGHRLLATAPRPYFVMELVRGIPITDFCDQKRLSVRERLELFIQVCQAVQHAHQKGIIHRDLKPSNVLVTMNDTQAVPKVIDFGIAKALSGLSLATSTSHRHSYHTGFAQLIGTPLYMSPEQAEMNAMGVDTRSDVYSLGVLLY